MARITFAKTVHHVSFLDAKEDDSRKSLSFEIRKDFLTGKVSRVLPFRRRIPEMKWDEGLLEDSRKDCPFCPGKLPAVTPRFVPEMASEGRIRKGEAWLFPNAFPYARHSWVVVLCRDHFLHLDQFSIDILRDGFAVAQEGMERVERTEPHFRYGSINWNYLPQSGAGLFHPHLQIVIEDVPTVSHQRVMEGLRRYEGQCGALFWEDYVAEEKRIGERYLGNCGKIHFLIAFSPAGILGEILVLFSDRSSIKELTVTDWEDLAQGLNRVFRFFKATHIGSFNLSIFSGNDEGTRSWVYGRLCPRIVIPPWGTSDINYFERLHDEVICVIPPEEMFKNLKPYFADRECKSTSVC